MVPVSTAAVTKSGWKVCTLCPAFAFLLCTTNDMPARQACMIQACLPPQMLLWVLQTACVTIFRFLTGLFCRCATNQSRQKSIKGQFFYHLSCKQIAKCMNSHFQLHRHTVKLHTLTLKRLSLKAVNRVCLHFHASQKLFVFFWEIRAFICTASWFPYKYGQIRTSRQLWWLRRCKCSSMDQKTK